MSAYGLSQQLGITPEEARGLMDVYFERFGGVRDYLASVVDEARMTGYTETLMGRRRYLPDLTSDNRQRREMAERRKDVFATVAADGADDVARGAGSHVRAFEQGEVAVLGRAQQRGEIVFSVIGYGPGRISRNEKPGARPGLR